MHWCMDETLAVLSLIPYVGIAIARIRARMVIYAQKKIVDVNDVGK